MGPREIFYVSSDTIETIKWIWGTFSKKVGTRGLNSGIKGSVSFNEQTIIKQVPFAKGMFYTKGRSL